MRRIGAVLVVLSLVVLGGCGDDDDGSEGDASGADATNVIEVTEDDYSFAFDGDLTAGTATFAVENVGEEFHMLGMCRLRDGKTVDDARKAAGAEDEEAFDAVCEEDAAIDAAGGGATPGAAYEVTVSGLRAGRYAAVCFLPDEEGEPHFELGMVGEFEIAEGDASATPDADVTYTATKEKLDGPASLDAGPTTIEVVTEEGAPDEVVLLKIKDGKTADEVDAYFKSLDEGGFYRPSESPVDFLYFAFDSTDTRYFTVDLEPGTWAVSVNDSDREGEAPDPDEDPHLVQIEVS